MENKIVLTQQLRKPQRDTKFAKRAADILVDIVKQNKWSINIGGKSDHLMYEAWQTLGKYYGYTVKTGKSELIEIDGITGFKANAIVINEITGIEVGGAEAYCMKDENNWKNKPIFQLASMAQTRAGAKALRQILGFVVALAGYSPTPAEEMNGNGNDPDWIKETNPSPQEIRLASPKQVVLISILLNKKGQFDEDLKKKYKVESKKDLTSLQASTIIDNLNKLPDKTNDIPEVDINDIPKNL